MNDKLKREAAEQQAEARAGVKDALASGASFRQVMQEAAGYGVKPEEVAEIRKEMETEGHER